MYIRGSSLPQYIALYAKVFVSNLDYLFYGLCDSEVILKDSGQNTSFSVKSEVLARGQTPSYP